MKSHVAELLRRQPDGPTKICVLLSSQELEMVEKLSLFFTKESQKPVSRDRVIEEAVRAFTDESVDYIASRYDIDLRSITLAEMEELGGGVFVDIAARDTIVLPAKDTVENRKALFVDRCWSCGRIDPEKLAHIHYFALYWGSPHSSITHYAKLISFEPSAEEEGKLLLRFGPPEELHYPVRPKEKATCLRRPRYTTLSLLLESKTLEELFD